MTALSDALGTLTIGIASTPTVILCRTEFADVIPNNKNAIKSWHVGGSMTDANIKLMFEYLDLSSNAALINPIAGERALTGFSTTPTNAIQNSVREFVVLTFAQADPINALKTISKAFLIPAWKDEVMAVDGTVSRDAADVPSAAVDALIYLLTDNLAFKDHAGTWHVGGWSYQASESGFGNVGGKTV